MVLGTGGALPECRDLTGGDHLWGRFNENVDEKGILAGLIVAGILLFYAFGVVVYNPWKARVLNYLDTVVPFTLAKLIIVALFTLPAQPTTQNKLQDYNFIAGIVLLVITIGLTVQGTRSAMQWMKTQQSIPEEVQDAVREEW